MRFSYDGHEYSISFKRETKDITRFNGEVVKSRFPITTVTLSKKTGDKQYELVREASVKTSKGDEFTFEKGRLAALRSVSRTLDKPFKKALWKAYISRPRG